MTGYDDRQRVGAAGLGDCARAGLQFFRQLAVGLNATSGYIRQRAPHSRLMNRAPGFANKSKDMTGVIEIRLKLADNARIALGARRCIRHVDGDAMQYHAIMRDGDPPERRSDASVLQNLVHETIVNG